MLLFNVRVFENRQLVLSEDVYQTFELGRQELDEPPPFVRLEREGGARFVIGRTNEKDISRRHAQLTALPDGRVRLTNQSATQSIRLEDGQKVPPGSAVELALPVILVLGGKTVRVQGAAASANLLTLSEATQPPGVLSGRARRVPSGTIDARLLVQSLQTAMDVLQAAADSPDFFERAAAAAVDLINLDSGQVLLLERGEWRAQAVHGPGSSEGKAPSRHILSRVFEEKRTYWEALDGDALGQQSLLGISAVVAAPILARTGAVLGTLYGERRVGLSATAQPITEVEAMLVELLARGVAAGLARVEQEQAALSERVRFEQFFTPKLARQLAARPDLLEGHEAEVSVLFCDIRGFSRISERLGPGQAMKWINATLDMLSACVLAEDGVLVDYVGDELMAMWGAPEAQPDHARRACRAALAMLAGLPALNEHWAATLQEPLAVGIGINTGLASVGNTGSRIKFKYGATGNTVNLASRVQGATKHLKCRLLITRATRAALDESYAVRRLGLFQVVNIVEPVELYELAPADEPGWNEARAAYEGALKLFETKELAKAARTLGNWRARQPNDDPALVLLYRAVKSMVEGPEEKHPVMVLAGK